MKTFTNMEKKKHVRLGPVEPIASVCYVCSVFGQSRSRLHPKTRFGWLKNILETRSSCIT